MKSIIFMVLFYFVNKLVLITGFSNPASTSERVASVLASHFNYDNFDYLTLGEALAKPLMVENLTKKAEVFTHSAGFIALKGSSPQAIHAFNAPFASSRLKLATQTLLRLKKEKDLRAVNAPLRTDMSFAREAIAHPIMHLGAFLKGEISSFNPLELALEAQSSGIDVGLAYTDRDCYSQPTDAQIEEFRSRGIKIAQILGVHDELLLRPVETVNQYFTQRY